MIYNTELIGTIIKKERKNKGWTQDKLAKKLNVSHKQVSNYETGALVPPLDNLFRLCELFECELGYLLGESDYSDKTKLETLFCSTTGFTREALQAIIYLTERTNKSSGENKSVINNLITSSLFPNFIDRLTDVDHAISNYNSIWKTLEEKIGSDLLDDALTAYTDPSIDYLNDTEYQKEHPDVCNAISELDKSISKAHDISGSIDIARYHLNKAMESLVDNIYPHSKYDV